LTKDDVHVLKHIDVDKVKLSREKRQICQSQTPIPCSQSRFRTADGSCNNLRNTRWGKSFECVTRLLDPEYADGCIQLYVAIEICINFSYQLIIGVSVPRVARSGQPLPNARTLSGSIHPQEDVSANFTHMLMQFGQFLDHDISLSPVTQLRTGAVQCCPRPTHPDCFEISIPKSDPFFAEVGKTCMNFVRSIPCQTCRFGPRLQINELTSFIDASSVYGNTRSETNALRDRDGMKQTKLQIFLSLI